MHRREDVLFYSTNLTDAEWALVADLFERAPCQRGTLAHYSRRALVNTYSYALRTGCAWRLLPTTFPPWQAAYKTFVRWVAAGVFEQMQGRLRERWRLLGGAGRMRHPDGMTHCGARRCGAPHGAAPPVRQKADHVVPRGGTALGFPAQRAVVPQDAQHINPFAMRYRRHRPRLADRAPSGSQRRVRAEAGLVKEQQFALAGVCQSVQVADDAGRLAVGFYGCFFLKL